MRTGLAVLALLPLAATLGGCGMDRDQALAEKIARAEAAARRAEAAQAKAESAAMIATGQSGQNVAANEPPPPVVEEDMSPSDDEVDNAIPEQEGNP